MSPGRIVSDPIWPAFRNLSEKPRAGCTAVARVTRSLTDTTNASPDFCTDPAKISLLLGPTRGKTPHDEIMPTRTTRATDFAHRLGWVFTARSPRPIMYCLRSFFCKLPESVAENPALVNVPVRLQSATVAVGPRCRISAHHRDLRVPASCRPPAAATDGARAPNKSRPEPGCFKQIAAIVLVGLVIRALGPGKELGQRLVRDEFRLGIDRIAKDLQRNSAPQHLLGGGGIDGDGTARFVQTAAPVCRRARNAPGRPRRAGGPDAADRGESARGHLPAGAP